MPYYPIFLDLTARPAVVIGGGAIATGKVQGLLAAGATVTVVAPELTPALQSLALEGAITHHPRAYRPGDLAGAQLAICATDDGGEYAARVNALVWQEATERGIFVNVVDDPPHCSFIAPSIARRGDLTVAVSTGGKAPALAVRVREQIESLIGDEHARFLELAGQLRQPMAERHSDFATRKRLWYELVDSDVLDLLRQGDEAAALDHIRAITGITLEPIDLGG